MQIITNDKKPVEKEFIKILYHFSLYFIDNLLGDVGELYWALLYTTDWCPILLSILGVLSLETDTVG